MRFSSLGAYFIWERCSISFTCICSPNAGFRMFMSFAAKNLAQEARGPCGLANSAETGVSRSVCPPSLLPSEGVHWRWYTIWRSAQVSPQLTWSPCGLLSSCWTSPLALFGCECRAPKEWFTGVLVNLENSSNQTVRWWWHRRNLPKVGLNLPQLLADFVDAIKIFVKVSKAVACGWISEWPLQG